MQDAKFRGPGSMECPRCLTALLDERERSGVVVDVCVECRGVWLDRGEMEKLVARAQQEMEDLERRASPPRGEHRSDDSGLHRLPPERGYHHGRDDDSGVRRFPGNKKKRWIDTLGDLFD